MEFDVQKKVQEYYGGIAQNVSNNGSSCGCGGGSSCCDPISNPDGLYDVEKLKELPQEAIMASQGCANPLVFANLQEGEIVLDLGSGGGIDVLMASRYVGASGQIYGLDMTNEMLALANQNKAKMGVKNVEFLKGFIEEIPLADETVDVIMSNCVINLSDNKPKAFSEAYRVLKKGGRLAIADIVSLKEVPVEIRAQVQLWVGCIAGTLEIKKHKQILKEAGFHNIEITPVHIYNKAVIQQLMAQKKNQGLFVEGSDAIDWAAVDGAFAGAHITAQK